MTMQKQAATAGRGQPQAFPLLILLMLLLSAFVALSAAGPAAAAPATQERATQHRQWDGGHVVLAEDEGLTLKGRPAALHGKPAPELDNLTEASATAEAPLPAPNVFFRGAAISWTGRAFARPMTLTFDLPKTIFTMSSHPLFRYDGRHWRQITRAVVDLTATTASATITRPGRYALLLNREWRTVTQDGYTLVLYRGWLPRTVVRGTVAASGATDDPAVIAAVAAASGTTGDQAKQTLVSFDSSTEPVQVVTLTRVTTALRNWSDGSTVGRWFAPYDGGALPSPSTARTIYALPDSNRAVDVTLHQMKRGTTFVTGMCSNMTAQPGYGPWATGGGDQLYGPKVSTYPPPAYDPARTVILSDLRWEKGELDAIDW